jgi:cellulose synthase/poly-beta-1,6-N-acetylglucosamine synthase-like glycosyltransferase
VIDDAAAIFGVVTIAYFAALNVTYLAFTGVAWRDLAQHLRARSYAPIDETLASPLTPPVSVLLPAWNEQAGIVDSVQSLLALRYPEHEVLVVSDGSTDATLERLREAFDLVPAPVAARDAIATQPIVASYISRRHRNLRVIDKLNGGKGDALNAGLAVARFPYVCAVDADAIIEDDALLRVARPVIEDPDLVVAAGGIVRIANGCRIRDGRVEEVALPHSRLATFQVVEYFRAFLVGRVGWSSLRSLLIISGAFGLFRRAEVEAAGGWSTETVGEDAELVARLHRYLRERGEEYRIEFVPDPVCWTEAPEDLAQLARQRRRWQRGLGETIWRHRDLIGKPRFGAFGMLALPYFLVFELLGPAIEVAAFVLLPLAWAFGVLNTGIFVAFLATALVLGVVLSVAALALEEFSFRRHGRDRDVARMLLFAVLENFGFRQLVSFWRLTALVELVRGRGGWGVMERRGLARPDIRRSSGSESAPESI